MTEESNRSITDKSLTGKMRSFVCFLEMHEKCTLAVILSLWLLFVVFVYMYKNCYSKIYTENFEYSDALQYCIDEISVKNAQISGWCLKPGADIRIYDIRLILWSDALGYGYVVPAMLNRRSDMTGYMDDGYNYEKSGFSCMINPKFIKKEAYRILIQYQCDGSSEVADTGKYYIPDYAVTYREPDTSGQLAYYVDGVSVADGMVYGWCFKQGKDLEQFDIDLILWNEDMCYGYQCPGYMLKDENITAEFNDGYNYDKSRFVCTLDNSMIRNGNYKVYIHYQCDGENEAVDTGIFYNYYEQKAVRMTEEPDLTGKLAYELETVSDEDMAVSGWCCEPGESMKEFGINLILWKQDRGYGYAIPAYMDERKDITQRFDDGCNYDQCGFFCDLNGNRIVDGRYRIYIQYACNGQEQTVDTGQYIRVEE